MIYCLKIDNAMIVRLTTANKHNEYLILKYVQSDLLCIYKDEYMHSLNKKIF